MERVLILRGADLLSEIGPRHLIGLAEVAREVEIVQGDTLYAEEDPSDALYIVVEGRVRLSTDDRTISEPGPGDAFGTWSLVDDSARGHRAVCVEAGVTLAVHRDDFYDLAAGDLSLLTELVRVLAKRLRALVAERPEEAHIEAKSVETFDALTPGQTVAPSVVASADIAPPPAAGIALAAAALGHPAPETDGPPPPGPVEQDEGGASPKPRVTGEPPPPR